MLFRDISVTLLRFVGLAWASYIGSTSTMMFMQTGGQVGSPSFPPVSDSLVEWAIKQGGALLVLLVVLFFYRRDYHGVTDFWKEQNKIVTELVIASTKAQADMTNALRENNMIVHQAKNVLQQMVPPERRDLIVNGVNKVV